MPERKRLSYFFAQGTKGGPRAVALGVDASIFFLSFLGCCLAVRLPVDKEAVGMSHV